MYSRVRFHWDENCRDHHLDHGGPAIPIDDDWLQYEYRPRRKSGIARETVPIIHGDTGHFAGQSGPAAERGAVQPAIFTLTSVSPDDHTTSVYITR